MAIIPENEYPGQTDPADSNYPFGSAKNESAPDQLDGTPWERAVINDWFGFFQRLLTEASITPSGSPDNVNDSDYWDALEAQIDVQLARTVQRVVLGGDFAAGDEVVCIRHGNLVTVTSDGVLTHSLSGLPTSAAGVIPAGFRPSAVAANVYSISDTVVREAKILADGDLILSHRDWSGSASPQTLAGTVFSLTYAVTDDVT